MATRDMPDRVGHRQHGESEGEGDPHEADPRPGESRGEHCAAAAAGDEDLVDLESLSLGGTDGTLSLQAGDTIHVLPAARIFVSGEVKEEGAVSWREGMTAWQALSKAGGPTRTAKLKGAYVLRQGSTIEVDLKAVKQGKAEDVILRPDDQLVLPESIF